VEHRNLTPPPRAFAQTATPFYEKGNVRIHYQEAGSGFLSGFTPAT